jgi:hypothetical protein
MKQGKSSELSYSQPITRVLLDVDNLLDGIINEECCGIYWTTYNIIRKLINSENLGLKFSKFRKKNIKHKIPPAQRKMF